MLTVLETLGPTERAVFVLREIFEVPYGEIAEAIDRPAARSWSPTAAGCRPRCACRSAEPGGWRGLLARLSDVVETVEIASVWLNGAPAGRIDIDGDTTAVSLVVEDGRVTRIYAVRNPQKLAWLDEPADLSR